MGKIPLEVIHTEEISMSEIPIEDRPPIKFELLKNGETINVEIPEGYIQEFYTIEDGKTELYIKGIESPLIAKGTAEDLMKRICARKKGYREKEGSERVFIEMPEELIGSLTSVKVQTKKGVVTATKLFQRGTNNYIIINEQVMDIMKKLCPNLN